MKYLILITMLFVGCSAKTEECINVAMKKTKELRSQGWQFHGVITDNGHDTGIFMKDVDVINLDISKEGLPEVNGWTIVGKDSCVFENVNYSVITFKKD